MKHICNIKAVSLFCFIQISSYGRFKRNIRTDFLFKTKRHKNEGRKRAKVHLIRYADDFIITAGTKEIAIKAKALVNVNVNIFLYKKWKIIMYNN